VLVVKQSSLGDVIQTLPVLHDILARHPLAQIDWVVEEAFADLLRSVPSISRVIPIAQRRWRRAPWSRDARRGWAAFWADLHLHTYDVVIDFQGLIKSARVARGARLSPGGFSITYANASDWCAYEWPVRYMLKRCVPMEKTIHAVARYRSLAARAWGQDPAPVLAQTPTYPWPQRSASHPRCLVLAHGTTRADNAWPMADWLGLAQRLVAEGWTVALPHANDSEAQWAAQLQSAIGEACVVWPRMGLADLRQRMADCGGVIGVDSGLGHLAVALDLPTVIIFSQPRVARAGPIGRAHQMAVGGDTAPEPLAVWAAWQSVAMVDRAGVPSAAIKVTAPNDITSLSSALGTMPP
jgi:heptosyltransferase-1